MRLNSAIVCMDAFYSVGLEPETIGGCGTNPLHLPRAGLKNTEKSKMADPEPG